MEDTEGGSACSLTCGEAVELRSDGAIDTDGFMLRSLTDVCPLFGSMPSSEAGFLAKVMQRFVEDKVRMIRTASRMRGARSPSARAYNRLSTCHR